MHELSIAERIVSIVSEVASQEGAERVNKVSVRIGDLSGVVPEALEFTFDIASAGTLLEGAALEIEEVPIAVYCDRCGLVGELVENYHFCCPICQHPSNDIRQGRELDVVSVEVD